MCQASSPAIGHPRWGWLYATALVPLAMLAAVELGAGPGPLRAALRYALALAAVAGLRLWVRRNGVALDLQEWCECAPATLAVHVVRSRRAARPAPHVPVEAAPVSARAEPELLRR